MATNRRDVTLGVAVQTSGEDGLNRIGEGLHGVADAAGAATPDIARMSRELEALAAATAAKRSAESAAKAEAAAARAEYNAQADALARLRAATDTAGRASADYRTSETALKVALTEARIALRERQSAMSAAANDAKAAATAERALADQIAATTRSAAAGNTAVATSLADIKGQLSALRNVALAATGGTIVGSLVKDVAAVAEGYQNLSARLKIATGDGDAFKATMQGVFDVSNRTGVAVDEVGALVTKLITAGKELGITNTQALGLSETLVQALRIGGASAQEAASSVLQFSQAMASGKLAGDELKSILEGAPRLAKALADGLGVTVGQLKELGSTGALTSAQVVAALQGQGQALQAEFDRMPVTVSRAMAQLSNAWTAYVGHANEGGGATNVAAAAIQGLAKHLDTVASLLFSAGKAAAAFYAVRLAGAFLETAAAAGTAATATATATAATVAHTAATRANAAAQAEGAAATASTAAGVGRLAGILATLKLAALVTVVTNLREIGTALGEGVAKLAGYGKAVEQLDAVTRAEAETTRANTAARAAAAQALQQATDKALGLGKEARALVAEFDGVLLKTSDTTEALDKLSKSLRLEDLSGIAAAGAALDALGQRGKLSADQIKSAMASALKGDDLLIFETNARAAFDKSEQGARRLKAALDAIADESLKRAGTSAAELKTGFSVAMNSAINDVDTLDRTLKQMGVTADETGRILAGSLDKALTTANTERAVQALIDRWQALGKEGRVTGDALTAGLEKARAKLDELRPGINSLAEAFKTLGLQTRESLQATADKAGEAYRTIAASGQASIGQQIEAFGKWREAALAASGGVVTEQVRLQEVVMETRARAAGLGDAFEKAMKQGTDGARAARDAMRELGSEAANAAAQMDAVSAAATKARNASDLSVYTKGGARYDANGFAKDAAGNTITGGGQLKPPDDSGNWQFVNEARANVAAQRAGDNSLVVQGIGYWKNNDPQYNGLTTRGPSAAPAATAPAPTPASTTHSVFIKLGDATSTTVNTASADDATALVGMLKALETARGRAA